MSEQKQPCPKEAYIIGYFGGEEIDKQHKVWVDFTVLVDLLYGFEQSIKSKPKEPETVLQLSDEDKKSLFIAYLGERDILMSEGAKDIEAYRADNGTLYLHLSDAFDKCSISLSKDQAKILAAWLNLSSE